MRNSPIGVFDSGLGGLTVARELARSLPDESIIYLGDTLRCPYGPRDLLEVREFALEIASFLASHDVKLIVIACNTATAAALDVAQREFDVPVIGVVEPGARAAVRATRNRRVGVIGTVGTIESEVYSRALRALDAGTTVFSRATPRFVEIVEDGLKLDSGALEDIMADASDVFLRPALHEMARDYLDPLKRCGIDTLVLGCTHYPILIPLIRTVMGEDVALISSAEETAREVASTLERRGHRADPDRQAEHRFFTTSHGERFSKMGSRVFGAPLGDVAEVTIDELIAARAAYLGRREAPACDLAEPDPHPNT